MGRKKANAEAAAQREWELGIDWARWLLDGNVPQRLQVYGVVLEPNEFAYLQTTAQYSRMYGGNGRYTTSGGFFIGKPGMVLGMMAANAAVNASRKAAAKRDMQASWRDVQELPVLATNLRLMCHLPAKGWMSFYYSAVQEFYPDTDNWMITFGFQNAVPLRIAGLTTPTLAVLAAWCVHGNGRWHGEPGIASLVQAALSPRGPVTTGEVSYDSTAELQDDRPADTGNADTSNTDTSNTSNTGNADNGNPAGDTGNYSTGNAYEDLIRSKLSPEDRR